MLKTISVQKNKTANANMGGSPKRAISVNCMQWKIYLQKSAVAAAAAMLAKMVFIYSMRCGMQFEKFFLVFCSHALTHTHSTCCSIHVLHLTHGKLMATEFLYDFKQFCVSLSLHRHTARNSI